MIKRTIYNLFIIILCSSLIMLLTSCTQKTSRDDGNFEYPDYPLVEDNGIPSWEQGDKEPIEIDWYVDRSNFYWAGAAGSAVSKMIFEKTGIKINFMTPLNDDGTMLNSLLNSSNMPDLISIDINNTTRVQMQESGYAYPLDGLAQRWAPNLFNNWSSEINEFFAATDGRLYGIPSLYYSMDDIAAFDDQKSILQANSTFIARSDYLDAYLSYAASKQLYDSFIGTQLDDFTISNSREAAEYAVTRKSNFIKMCEWVKNTYSPVSTILTDAFTVGEDNKGLYRLAQYFAVPREGEDGSLLYLEEQEGFYECLAFLNECYRKGLISDSNFSNTKQQQYNILLNGQCFVMMCSPQDYGGATRDFAKKYLVNNEVTKQYVGIVITDDEGTPPTMENLAGNGDTFTMVSTDCERPDRVIKLIDYLTSFEGQMLTYFGVQNEHWYYEIEPGQTIRDDKYVLTKDQSFQSGKTYYELMSVDSTKAFDSSKTYYIKEKEYFKKSYTIEFLDNVQYFELVQTSDAEKQSSKSYYELQVGPERTYKYGRVMWYKNIFQDISNATTSKHGFLTFQLLRPNKAIAKLATYSGDEMYHFSTYLTYNIKAVVSDWLYTSKLLKINNFRDASGGDNYLEITTTATMCSQKWRENVAKIITQRTEEECRKAYEATLQNVKKLGIDDVIAFDNQTFQKVKAKFGIDRVWAPLVEGYNPPKVKSIYGNTDYCVEIPAFVGRK